MRLRLILSFILVVLVTIAAMVGVTLATTAREVNAFMLRGGMTGVDELATTLEDYYTSNGSWAGADRLLAGAGMGQGMMHGGGPAWASGMMNQRIRLADADGNVLVDTGGDPGTSLSSSEIQDSITMHSRGKVVGYLLPEGGVSVGSAAQQNLITRLNRAAIIAALIATALSLALVFLLTYRLLRPVQDLTRASQQLAGGNYSQQVKVRGDDELAQLGKAFNSMTGSLQRAQETRKAMTADIAHELRTPLAIQRAHLEALQDGIYPLTPENLSPVLEQTQVLSRLVDDLRTLALADAGELAVNRSPVDLVDLAGRTVERFAPQAASRQVKLLYTSQPGIPPVNLDAIRFDQILGNLLTNALRYTPEGGQIAIDVAQKAGKVAVSIHDSGPGIREEDLPHVFERFYRADKSRSRQEGGTGLGLAIARKLAEAHGGTIRASNHPQGGAVFTIELPLETHGNHK